MLTFIEYHDGFSPRAALIDLRGMTIDEWFALAHGPQHECTLKRSVDYDAAPPETRAACLRRLEEREPSMRVDSLPALPSLPETGEVR